MFLGAVGSRSVPIRLPFAPRGFQGRGLCRNPTQGDAPRLSPLRFALGWSVEAFQAEDGGTNPAYSFRDAPEGLYVWGIYSVNVLPRPGLEATRISPPKSRDSS